MATLSTAGDLERVKQEQRTRAVDLFGLDVAAQGMSQGARIPLTPPSYAELVFYDWAGTFHGAAAKEARTFIASSRVEVARQQKRTLSPEERSALADEGVPLTLAMSRALDDAGRAMRGATVLNRAGVRVLQPRPAADFWGAISTYVINLQGTKAVVTDRERWRAFFQGMTEGAQNLGDAVGRVSANVLATAGKSIGAGVGGFFDELGLVQTAVVFAGGVVLWRFL